MPLRHSAGHETLHSSEPPRLLFLPCLRRHEDAPEQHRLRQLPAERAVADLDHHAGREVHGPPLHRLTQGVGQLLPAPHGGKRRGGGPGGIDANRPHHLSHHRISLWRSSTSSRYKLSSPWPHSWNTSRELTASDPCFCSSADAICRPLQVRVHDRQRRPDHHRHPP